MQEYSELKVRIERGDEEAFKVTVAGPSGEASGAFRVPLSEVELENLVLRVSRPRQTVRRVDSPEMELIRRFGNELFDSVFQSRVRDVYRDSYAQARAEGKGLRVTLALTDAPDLMNLPWEFLYDEPSFLSISTWTPVVRYLNLPRARRPLPVTTPLRILAMVSAPSDAVVLDVEHEKRLLEEALADLVASGSVEISWLDKATLRALQRELRRGPYHVFHFIGHGGYDHVAEDGVLLLEDEEGRGRRVSGSQLGTMLADHTTLRLAVLNACEGARTSIDDPFAGVAASLVQREIPAVIGMQFEITDRAAIVFGGEFYAALADGYPVDSAVAEARKAIFADANDIEWGTPVLFMRVPDGRIFDVAPRAEPVEATDEEPPQPSPAPAAEPAPVAVAPIPVEDVDEPEPEPRDAEPAEALPLVAASAPVPAPPEPRGAAAETPAAPDTAHPQRSRARPAALLALVGAAVALVANASSHVEGEPAIGTLAAYTPETIGVPILVGVVALLLLTGRIRDRLAYGLLLGFGLLTVAGAIGMALRPGEIDLPAGNAPLVLLAGGAVVLTAAIVGILGGDRVLDAPGTRFRWLPASLLAAAGAAVGAVALFVPFGRLEDGSDASIVNFGGEDLTWFALEPIVGVATAIAVAYALGRGGGRQPLAAGVALAVGAQTALYYGTWLGTVLTEYYMKGELGAGCFIGFAAGALLVGAGLVSLRSP